MKVKILNNVQDCKETAIVISTQILCPVADPHLSPLEDHSEHI